MTRFLVFQTKSKTLLSERYSSLKGDLQHFLTSLTGQPWDKGYHTEEFVEGMRALQIEPHPALKAGQNTWGVIGTTAHAASQKVRKRIEEIFGWTKTTGGFRKSRYRGVKRTHAAGQYVVATWNLVRMAKLMMTAPPKFARA